MNPPVTDRGSSAPTPDVPLAQPATAHGAPGHHTDVGSAPPVKPASTGRMVALGVLAAVLLAGLFVMSFLPRRAVTKELAADVATESAPPTAEVAVVHRATAGGTVDLPGTLQALHEGAIYARVSGYVKKWNVDIGGLVHAGEVLAEIDAPELGEQVQQAQQQVAQARAALALTRTDLDRWKQMVADSAVSREEYDQKQSAFDVATANTGAAEANLQRLVAMQNFTRVTAPFSGVVTARDIDLGSLITAAGATSASVAGGDASAGQGTGNLFRIAETDTVRTYVPVPESYSPMMRVGLPADVTVSEIPGRTFMGHIARTSNSIDVASRTLLTEVDIANPGFVLLPGMYAQVHLQFQRVTPPLVIPSSALVIRSDGTQVMVLDSVGQDRSAIVHLRPVQTGRDYGATIEILSGLTDGATVVTNPSAEMSEGMRVHVAPASDQAAHAPIK
jgi:RND family efflux transporter MFP subunit